MDEVSPLWMYGFLFLLAVLLFFGGAISGYRTHQDILVTELGHEFRIDDGWYVCMPKEKP